MKKVLALVLVIMFVGAVAAHAGDTSSSSCSESGWQKTYDSIASWSWSKKSN